MSTRPSVISTLGIVGAVLLLAGIVAWTIARGPTMFSPGALNGMAASKPKGSVRTLFRPPHHNWNICVITPYGHTSTAKNR